MTDNQSIIKVLFKNLIMRLKNNVRVNSISSELMLGLCVLDNLFYSYYGDRVFITSVAETDTKHNYKSLHYSGNALDVRLPIGSSSTIEKLKDEFDSMCAEFDLVIEDDHLHLEFQPKIY